MADASHEWDRRIPPSIDTIRAAMSAVINRIIAPCQSPPTDDPDAFNARQRAMGREIPAADQFRLQPLFMWLRLCGANPPWANEIFTACSQYKRLGDDNSRLLLMLQDVKQCVDTAKLTLPPPERIAQYPKLIDFVAREIAALRTAERDVQYVTLEQIAAIINRSKRTVEKWKSRPKNPLPWPDIEGGGGKPAEWLWKRIRKWLVQNEADRPLPETYPSSRMRTR